MGRGEHFSSLRVADKKKKRKRKRKRKRKNAPVQTAATTTNSRGEPRARTILEPKRPTMCLRYRLEARCDFHFSKSK